MLRNTTSAKCPYCHRRTSNPGAHLAENPKCATAHREQQEGTLKAAVEKHIGIHGYQVGNIVIVTSPGAVAEGVMGVPVVEEPHFPRGRFVVMSRTGYEAGKRYREEAEKRGGRGSGRHFMASWWQWQRI